MKFWGFMGQLSNCHWDKWWLSGLSLVGSTVPAHEDIRSHSKYSACSKPDQLCDLFSPHDPLELKRWKVSIFNDCFHAAWIGLVWVRSKGGVTRISEKKVERILSARLWLFTIKCNLPHTWVDALRWVISSGNLKHLIYHWLREMFIVNVSKSNLIIWMHLIGKSKTEVQHVRVGDVGKPSRSIYN